MDVRSQFGAITDVRSRITDVRFQFAAITDVRFQIMAKKSELRNLTSLNN